ncbi:uncharacterized protein G2W53_012257 [Senna tora]|uniref:Uncharacterized protein n=1 Tax=Senna tora TaxID=362788 RepID=A0A834WSJ0_9FABA|nr:uncharacterized protein G2W53_012257 [Senna tora]
MEWESNVVRGSGICSSLRPKSGS